ncbi:MAG: 7-cyano-7-deazaguanine synthase QueC [Thermodesulfobacteriota bacterium]
MGPSKRCVVLLSGGLDSSTVLAMAREQGYSCYCLSFAYGQRQAVELQRATAIAKELGAREHLILNLDLDKIGGSALTSDLEVPKDRSPQAMTQQEIPITYVPGRNTIFLSHAAAWAEVLGAFAIFIGVNAVDYSGYPDCRPEYIKAMETLINLGTKAGQEQQRRFTIHTPLLQLRKGEIIARGLALGVDYGQTLSCYDPSPAGLACGHCDACLLRRKGFSEAGIPDPTPYQEE